MTLFDRYVVVDWSAAASPRTGVDSIWIAVLGPDGEAVLSNPSTRAAAEASLRQLVDDAGGARTLLAVDASLGYPSGSAAWFGLAGEPAWRAWWDELAAAIVDDGANRNNRFEIAAELNRRGGGSGPFWGRPRTRELPHLAATKPAAFPVPEYRLAEVWLRRDGRRPASCWQLLGVGSVGSQTLTILPILRRLIERAGVEVWPFTTGLDVPEAAAGVTVVTETWPTAFDIDPSAHPVRDAAQVDGVARRIRAADRCGTLPSWFAPSLADDQRLQVEQEEGWVLAPLPERGRATSGSA